MNNYFRLINSHDGHDNDEEGDEGFPTLSQEQVRENQRLMTAFI